MKFTKPLFALLGALLALTGCSKADLLNAFVPRTGYTLHRDIAYGNDPRQMMDIYVPSEPDKAHSVVVFFHGGSWKSGSKDLYRFIGQAFTSRGYTVVIANYRLYPDVHFPAFMHDGADAVAWVHNHIGDYGADAKHLYLMGHSAGAHIAVLLTLDRRYLKEAGGNSSWIRGTIGLAGPYDFLPITDPEVKAVFSKVDEKTTQPIHYVHKGVPPLLLLTGDEDDEVGPKNTINLTRELRKYGNSVELHEYEHVGHIGIVLALAEMFRNKGPVLDDIDGFMCSHNKDGKAP